MLHVTVLGATYGTSRGVGMVFGISTLYHDANNPLKIIMQTIKMISSWLIRHNLRSRVCRKGKKRRILKYQIINLSQCLAT